MLLAGFLRYQVTMNSRGVDAASAVVQGNGLLDLVAGSGDVVEAAFVDDACTPPVEVRVTWTGGVTDRLLGTFTRCWDGPTCDRSHRFQGAKIVADPPAPIALGNYPELAADGWASPEPYRAWHSPSWNGAFWVDLSKLKTAKGAPPAEVLGEPGLRRLDPAGANLFFTLFPKLLGL